MSLRKVVLILFILFPFVEALLAPIVPPPSITRRASRVRPLRSTDESLYGFPVDKAKATKYTLECVSLGMSTIYLAHFASLYTQLPGLFGRTGLLPISERIGSLNDLWALNLFSSPELGMEVFAALGILISASQITFRQLRYGVAGVVTFGIQWLLWHDLVIAGGRFMAYQMDLLLLDAAPLTLLAASGLFPTAATFGYRWLLSRLYIGAGAVKLLSCDASWRDLSAVHWHFQSQPLPNPIGAAAFLHLPESICQAITLFVLVGEMTAPFLFLAPSKSIRQVAFVLNLVLMFGIALFGNFGPLQAILIVIGFALLDDTSAKGAPECEDESNMGGIGTTSTGDNISITTKNEADFSTAITMVSLGLAGWAALWTLHDVGARCLDTWTVEPLVYGLVAVGGAAACLPFFQFTSRGLITALVSLAIFAGSAPTMADGLGVYLPFGSAFEFLNFGASPYGLFAIITGVNGRPVATIEAVDSTDGTWHYVPLLYQINDPSAPLPLCFPHFPRLDWTLWFIPLGEQGLWIARFFNGITMNDPAIMNLVDKRAFRESFPADPPSIVRVVPRKYELDASAGRGWIASEDPRYSTSPVLAAFARGDLANKLNVEGEGNPSPWPSSPLLRSLADAAGRPEYFIWGCLGTAEMTRRIVEVGETKRGDDQADDVL